MQHEMRYTELLHSLTGCTRRILSLQLQQLENDHIIRKETDPTFVPIKTRYHLTALGESLVLIIRSMDTWGRDYLKVSEKMPS